MQSLYANTFNETKKLLQRKKAAILISVAIPVVAAIVFVFFKNRLGIFAVNSANFPLLVLTLFTTVLLPLFVFSASAELFSGEVGDRTLKLTLIRPISRFKVFVSKHLAVGIFIVVSLATIFIISSVAGAFLGDNQLSQIFINLFAYAISIIPMLFLCIAAVFLAQFFRLFLLT